MTDTTNGGAPGGDQTPPSSPAAPATPAAGQTAQQNLGVLAQYVKDLSFENPGAPQSIRNRGNAPQIGITINVEPGEVVNNEVEVELKIDAQAKVDDDVLFAIELSYAGLFRLSNIPNEAIQPILRIECARLLFPFARQVVAEASRNGGFPPLLIDPIDFLSLYRQRLAQAQAAQQQTPQAT